MSFDFMVQDWFSSDILWQLINFVQLNIENAKFKVIYDKLL